MPITIQCPQCSRTLRVPEALIGQRGKCPACQHMFDITDPNIQPGAPAAAPPPPVPAAPAYGVRPDPVAPQAAYAEARFPQPADRAGGDAGYGRPDGFADFDRRAPGPEGIEDLTSNYDFQFGEYWNEGMQHYSAVLGPMVGYAVLYFVMVLVLGFVPCIGGLLRFCLDFALLAGFPLVCLAQLKNRPWTFGDFFGGFQFWVPLFVNQILQTVMTLVCMLPAIIAIVIMVIQQDQGQQGGRGPRGGNSDVEPILLIAAVLLGLVGMVPFMFLYTRCFMFNVYLILDRRCGPIQAIQGTWTLTRDHFWWWFLYSFCMGIGLALSALLTCGIGILFTLPIYFLVTTAAYLRISSTSAGPARAPLEEFPAQ